jgi:2-iminobutanoate/2-iminopropanoate deaminase
MKKIETADAPQAIGPYSQAILAGSFLFISGQIPIDPKMRKIVETTIQGQTKQVLANLAAILKAAGLSFKDVVKASIFLKDLGHFQEVNALYGEAFVHMPQPARETIQVARLPQDALIEISCIALKP